MHWREISGSLRPHTSRNDSPAVKQLSYLAINWSASKFNLLIVPLSLVFRLTPVVISVWTCMTRKIPIAWKQRRLFQRFSTASIKSLWAVPIPDRNKGVGNRIVSPSIWRFVFSKICLVSSMSVTFLCAKQTSGQPFTKYFIILCFIFSHLGLY